MTRASARWMVLLNLCAATAGCGKADHAEETVESAAPVVVRVAKAGPAHVDVRVKATGTTVPAPGAELSVTAPQAARVVAIPHGEGDRVARGELLVQFEIPSLASEVAARESALAQARARVANAQAARDRLTTLMERGVAARREVDDAQRDLTEGQAAISEATAGLGAARQLLARQRVTAPFDGVVVRRWHNPGDLVDTSTADPVVRFADPARIEAEALVTAADVSKVMAHQPAEVKGPGDARWTAMVIATPAAVDAATASARVRLSLHGNAPPPLGLPIEAAIIVQARDAAVAVPTAALVREGDTSVLFVVNGTKAVRREVRPGAVSSDFTEILSGVAAGETIVVSGQDGLPDGAVVSVAK